MAVSVKYPEISEHEGTSFFLINNYKQYSGSYRDCKYHYTKFLKAAKNNPQKNCGSD
jgi:hypothetical protein